MTACQERLVTRLSIFDIISSAILYLRKPIEDDFFLVLRATSAPQTASYIRNSGSVRMKAVGTTRMSIRTNAAYQRSNEEDSTYISRVQRVFRQTLVVSRSVAKII